MSASEQKAPEIADASNPTGVTDWLKRMKEQGDQPASAEHPASAPGDSAPLPEWLAFTQVASSEVEAPAPAASGDLPDWLTDFKADQQAAFEIPPAAAPSPEGLPDWLRSAQPEQHAAPSIPTPQPAQAEPGRPRRRVPSRRPARGGGHGSCARKLVHGRRWFANVPPAFDPTMRICISKEVHLGEHRVPMTPDSVAKLAKRGAGIMDLLTILASALEDSDTEERLSKLRSRSYQVS